MPNGNANSNFVERVFSIDLRSLALFRIALGALIIADLIFRWSAMVDMYTEEGFFTQELSFQFYDHKGIANWPTTLWSVYWISDSVPFVVSLFGTAAIAAVFLMLGKWTRIATIVSWVLLASIHVRNPLVTSSGDFLFKMMLFWSIFLPLNARWSLDSRKSGTSKHDSVCSMATAAYIFQLFAMYFFSGLAKWNPTWLNGNAMEYVLRLDIYIYEFGKSLLQYPELLSLTTWVTLFAEVFFVWTLFSFWRNGTFRLINMFVFWSFHIGIAACMAIGMFPWICIVAWLPLLPSFLWPNSITESSIDNKFKWNQLGSIQLATELFCLAAVALVLLWNVENTGAFQGSPLKLPLIKQLGLQMGIDQHFKMFGEPPSENPWFVYEGQLPDGSKVDLWRKTELSDKRPESGLSVFPNFHWRKLHRNLTYELSSFVRQPMLEYLVQQWNQAHPDQQIVNARLICYIEDIGPDYKRGNFKSSVWASYADEKKRPGSLFESFLQEAGELPF